MKTHKIIPSIAWVIIGGLICIAAKSLRLGSFRNPGSGMFPFLIGCAIALLSSLELITQLFSAKDQSGTFDLWPDSGGLKRAVGVIVLLIFYMMALKYLGFFLCTFVFFMALLKIVERKNWGYAILSSLIVSVSSYLLFKVLLYIKLPKGPLGI